MGIFGYDSVGDMFDGGGPGASGGAFQGGGTLSAAANLATNNNQGWGGSGGSASSDGYTPGNPSPGRGGTYDGDDGWSLPSSSAFAPSSGSGTVTQPYYTAYIGGQEYLIPRNPLGAIPAAQALMAAPLNLPDYQVADLTPQQLYAMQLAGDTVGLGQENVQQGMATTDMAMQQALAAGLDPYGGMGGTAYGMVDQGRSNMMLGALQSGAIGGGIPQLLQPGRQAADIGMANVLGGIETGQQVARAGQEAVDRSAERARQYTDLAQQQLQQAGQFGMGAAQQGMEALSGMGGQFDPESISAYMDPYEQQVVDQVLQDLARQGQMQRNELGAQAVGAGAYGGSRQAIAEQELARNVLGEQAKAAAQLRSQGYGQAQNAALTAYENAQNRALQGAGIMGQLGQAGAGSSINAAQAAGQLGLGAEELAQQGALSAGGLGMQGASMGIQGGQTAAEIGLNLSNQGLQGAQTGLSAAGQQAQIGQGLGSLGIQTGQLGQTAAGQQLSSAQTVGQIGQQQANLGQQLQGMNQADLNTLMQAGGLGQQQVQNTLEAQRLSQYQNAMAPYQQVGFLSDVVQGAPMGMTVTQSSPGPSPLSQVAGLALGGAALMNAFS